MRKRPRTPTDGELNDAFLMIPNALGRRPEPRGVWDVRARSDNRVPHPFADGVAACRSAMHAAIETSDRLVIRQTRLNIETYFLKCMESALDVGAVLDESPSVSDVVRDECDAVSALVRVAETRSLSAQDDATRKLLSSIDSSTALVRGMAIRRQGWAA